MTPATALLMAALLAADGDDDFKRKSDRSHLEGEPAPALVVESWLHTDGLELDELSGQVVLLDFWGTWSKPCRDDVARLKELWETRHEKGLTVIGIHTSDGWDKAGELVAAHGIRYAVCHDADRLTGAAYGVDSYPEYALIDKHGVLRFADLDGDDLELAVDYLLAESTGDLTEAVHHLVENMPNVRIELLDPDKDEVALTIELRCALIEGDDEELLELTMTRAGFADEELVCTAAVRDLGLRSLVGRSGEHTFDLSIEGGELEGTVQASPDAEPEQVELSLPPGALPHAMATLRAFLMPFEDEAEVGVPILDPEVPELSGTATLRYAGERSFQEGGKVGGGKRRGHAVEIAEKGSVQLTMIFDDGRRLIGVLPADLEGQSFRITYPD